ncbi:MAG: ABC transporter ATP-binding protein [Acidimicrobiales bacterium]
MPSAIELDAVEKIYPGDVVALAPLSLRVEPEELVVLIGPSGSGKSTALRLVAGLETITSGTIRIAGHDVTSEPPRQRDVAMVFQDLALYPHLSVAGNLGFGLKVRRTPKAEVGRRVAEVAELLELSDLLHRRPSQLSGGQQQRVAMGRAIIRRPQAFLMDEPLSALDARLRSQMREEIVSLQRRLGVATVFVTHDQVEAMTMADRVVVLDLGALQQDGAPRTVYDDPANVFVASFLGSPPMNLLSARVVTGEVPALDIAGTSLGIPRAHVETLAAMGSGAAVTVGIRPEALRTPGHTGSERPNFGFHVARLEHLGADVVGRGSLKSWSPSGEGGDGRGGAAPSVRVRFDPRTPITEGDLVPLTVLPSDLLFFDPATGGRIR